VSPILIEQVVPYVLGNSSIFKKGAPKQVDVHEGTWKVFGVWSREKSSNKEILFGTPSSKSFTHGCAKGFWGE
jgi:hypothetical protein